MGFIAAILLAQLANSVAMLALCGATLALTRSILDVGTSNRETLDVVLRGVRRLLDTVSGT